MKKPVILLGVVILVSLAIILVFLAINSPGPSTNVPVASSSSLSCTTVPVEAGDLSITNEISANVRNTDGTLTITYKYVIRNDGDYSVYNLFATSRFNHNTSGLFAIVSLTADGLNTNTGFNGMSDINLLSGTNVLPPHSTYVIYLTINLHYSDELKPFINYVDIAGKSDGISCTYVSSSSSAGTSSSSSTIRSTISSSSTGSGVPHPTATNTSTSSPAPVLTTLPSTSVSSSSSIPATGNKDLYDSAQVTFDFPTEQLPVITGGKGI